MSSTIQETISEFFDTKSVVDTPPVLPLMHSTTCENTESILVNNLLETTYCKVFKENLLYFFYGKPAYRVSSQIPESSTSYILAPCCFVVDYKKIKSARIFPFDTGAFATERYDEITKLRTGMCEYELSNRIEDIPQFICMFYENNNNYIEGNVSLARNKATTIASQALIDFLSSSGLLKYDDRARSVEISTGDNLELSDSVEAIVVPKPFKRNKVFERFVRAHPKIDVITYNPHYPNPVGNYNEAIFQKVYSYLASRRLCDE